MPTIDQIHKAIEARIVEITNEIATLGAARAQLQSSAATSRPPAAVQRSAARQPRQPPKAKAVSQSANLLSATGARDPRTANPGAVTGSNGASRLPADFSKRSTRVHTRPARDKQSVERLLADRLEPMLSDAEHGLSASAIAKSASAGYDQVLNLLKELERIGRVRRTGSLAERLSGG